MKDMEEIHKSTSTNQKKHLILEQKKLKLIAIAGTHGKTTTTAMTIWLFKQLGLPISYSVGAKIPFGDMGEFHCSFFRRWRIRVSEPGSVARVGRQISLGRVAEACFTEQVHRHAIACIRSRRGESLLGLRPYA